MGSGPPPLPRDAWHAERLYWQRNPPKRPPGYVSTKEAAAALGITVGVFRRYHGKKVKCIKRSGVCWWNADSVAVLKLAREIAHGK